MPHKPNCSYFEGAGECSCASTKKPKEPKKPKAEKAPVDPAIKRCIDAFYEAYVRKHNPPERAEQWMQEVARKVPVPERSIPLNQMVLPRILGAKDGTLIKTMLASWGEERVLEIVRKFFGEAYADWGVVNSNQDIPALYTAAPRILVRDRVPDRRTADNLSAGQRAMMRRGPR